MFIGFGKIEVFVGVGLGSICGILNVEIIGLVWELSGR